MRAVGILLVLGCLGGCAGTKSGSPATASEPVLEVFPLQFASAEAVAQELGKLESGEESRVVVDPRTNSLILHGSRGWIEKQKQRIAALDQAQKAVEVVPLRYAAAAELASTLNELLEASQRSVFRWCALPRPGMEDEVHRSDWRPDWPPWSVVADPRTNSLVVACSEPADLPRLLELIARLDVDAQAPH